MNSNNISLKNEMATAESLSAEIEEQTKLFNKLRLENAEPAAMEDVRKRLGELKKALGQMNAQAGGSGKKKERLLLKTPKVCSCSHSITNPYFVLIGWSLCYLSIVHVITP